MTVRIRDMSPSRVKDLIAKYLTQSFHYTEYPHKSFWSDKYSDADFRSALSTLNAAGSGCSQLLFVNVPFCRRQCLFCICHTYITNDYERVKAYMGHLFLELDMLRGELEKGAAPLFDEIHLGGGSPTMLHLEEFDRVIEKMKTIVDFSVLKRFSTEIDPRNTDNEKLKHYRQCGVTRLSFGIQDFNPKVQKAINRIQPLEMVEKLLEPETRKMFEGVNFDILCGMPFQTRKSFAETTETIIKLSPDRIMMMYLTYAPQLKRHHALMAPSSFPDSYEKLVIFDEAMHQLKDAGYIRVGMDHFAKPSDTLGKALKAHDVHWNSLGYRPGRCRDIIGAGSGASGMINPEYYFQNVYELETYATMLQKGKFPLLRGMKLVQDDIIRRDVIHTLRIYFEVQFADVERKHGIDFRKYFAGELKSLEALARDKILDITRNCICMTDIGSHFVLAVCKIFDNYGKVAAIR